MARQERSQVLAEAERSTKEQEVVRDEEVKGKRGRLADDKLKDKPGRGRS